jgi:hypothetical protein
VNRRGPRPRSCMAPPAVAAPPPPLGRPSSIAVDPTGKYVYVAGGGTTASGYVAQYAIATDGGLTPLSPFTVADGQNNTGVAVDPSGRYAYVTNPTSANSPGSVCQYTIAASGELTPMSPATVASGVGTRSIAVDPSGKYAYAVNMTHGTGPGAVFQYTIGAGGALAPMPTPSVAAGSASGSIAIAVVTSSSSDGSGGGGGGGGGGGEGGGGGGGGSGSVAGTWSGTYSLTSDFSYFCDNVATASYGGSVTIVITAVDVLGMLTGTVSMQGMTVASVNYSNGQCSMATLSPTAPIASDGGFVSGTSVRVNTDLGPSFGSYWGTNQLLFFSGTLNGDTIAGTIQGMTDGGTGGTSGTFRVNRQ